MIPILDLDIYFHNLKNDYKESQIEELYKVFKEDFMDNEFEVNGLKVKVILKLSNVDGFEEYPETFVHLITRKSSSGKRVFDRYRANKIHWVKPILMQSDDEEIFYYEYTDSKGITKDYYWYKEEDFIVIMKKITPDYLVITSFNIDGDFSRKNQERRYLEYRKALKK